jgi:hypothetical protein
MGNNNILYDKQIYATPQSICSLNGTHEEVLLCGCGENTICYTCKCGKGTTSCRCSNFAILERTGGIKWQLVEHTEYNPQP